jgi:hypothetical protein
MFRLNAQLRNGVIALSVVTAAIITIVSNPVARTPAPAAPATPYRCGGFNP